LEPNHEQAYQWETTVHNHIEFTNGSIIGTLLPLVGLVGVDGRIQRPQGHEVCLYVSGFVMVVGYVFIMANNFVLHYIEFVIINHSIMTYDRK